MWGQEGARSKWEILWWRIFFSKMWASRSRWGAEEPRACAGAWGSLEEFPQFPYTIYQEGHRCSKGGRLAKKWEELTRRAFGFPRPPKPSQSRRCWNGKKKKKSPRLGLNTHPWPQEQVGLQWEVVWVIHDITEAKPKMHSFALWVIIPGSLRMNTNISRPFKAGFK